jgi:flagellar basal body-associated protein FliL
MLNEQESKKEVLSHFPGPEDTKPKASGSLDGETTMEELKAEIGTKKETIQVHPMPGKFVAAAQQGGASKAGAKTGNAKKLILIAIVLILVIVAGIAGVLFFVSRNAQVPDAEQTIIENENTNEDTNTNTDTDQNENINENTNEDTNTNTDTDQNENINENTNENINTNENTNENIVETDLDSDNDGLSIEEELVFGTNPNLEDTDKDGYKDGQEITSLYNPLIPSLDLASSGLVKRFISPNQDYSFLRPTSWVAKTAGSNPNNIIVLPDSEIGESFAIASSENIDNWSLTEALNNMSQQLGSSANYQNYSLAGQSAFRSRNGKRILSIKDANILIISYEVNNLGATNFDNIFEMMLNSFEWLKTPDNLPGLDE